MRDMALQYLALRESELAETEYQVALAIARALTAEGEAILTYADIAQRMDVPVHPKTVAVYVQKLRLRRILATEDLRLGRKRRSTRYRMLLPPSLVTAPPETPAKVNSIERARLQRIQEVTRREQSRLELHRALRAADTEALAQIRGVLQRDGLLRSAQGS